MGLQHLFDILVLKHHQPQDALRELHISMEGRNGGPRGVEVGKEVGAFAAALNLVGQLTVGPAFGINHLGFVFRKQIADVLFKAGPILGGQVSVK